MVNNATYPPIEKSLNLNEPSYVEACKSYVYKFEKHVLEWEHDNHTQVEINDVIKEVLCTY